MLVMCMWPFQHKYEWNLPYDDAGVGDAAEETTQHHRGHTHLLVHLAAHAGK